MDDHVILRHINTFSVRHYPYSNLVSLRELLKRFSDLLFVNAISKGIVDRSEGDLKELSTVEVEHLRRLNELMRQVDLK